jgi:hypothetical protein
LGWKEDLKHIDEELLKKGEPPMVRLAKMNLYLTNVIYNLEAQNLKLRNCQNCKHCISTYDEEDCRIREIEHEKFINKTVISNVFDEDEYDAYVLKTCENLNKWEMKE